ncbi:hypothetical protein [Microcystis phage Mel-JY01]
MEWYPIKTAAHNNVPILLYYEYTDNRGSRVCDCGVGWYDKYIAPGEWPNVHEGVLCGRWVLRAKNELGNHIIVDPILWQPIKLPAKANDTIGSYIV